MSSGAWMVLWMVVVYFFTFSLSAAAVFHLFSVKLIPSVVRRAISKPLGAALLVLLLALTPPAVWLLFTMFSAGFAQGKAHEYADQAILGMWFVWFIVFKPTVPSLIVALISPDMQGFKNWRTAATAYGVHLAGTAGVIKTIGWML